MTPSRIGFAGSLLLHGGLVGMWWALADTPEGSSSPVEHSLPLTLAMFREMAPEPAPLGDLMLPERKHQPAVEPIPKAAMDKGQQRAKPAPSEPLALAAAPEVRAAKSNKEHRPQPEPPSKPRTLSRAREPQPTRPKEAEQRRGAPNRAVAARRTAKPSGRATPKPVTAIPTSADIAAKLEEEYLDRLWRALERSKFYPRRARRRGVAGRVEVRFRVLRDGSFEGLEVVGGSGSPLLDQAALATVHKASGAVPFPDELPKQSLVVSLPITYRWQ